jgi:hypothetical protein
MSGPVNKMTGPVSGDYPMHSRALVATFLCAVSSVATANDSDKWQFQVTPYLWLPTISGDLNYDPPPGGGGGAPGVDVGPTDWLDLLNGAALVNGGARKGRLSITADFVYLGMESDNDKVKSITDISIPGTPIEIPVDASINLSTGTDLDGITWTLDIGYAVKETDSTLVDVFVGVRYFDVDIVTSWTLSSDITLPGGGVLLPAQGSIENSVELWDGLVGLRGHFGLGESKWSVPFYLDVGTGDADLTWQAMAGFAYAYHWGDLMLVYRHLYYDEGDTGLLEDFSFSGPAFGARFRF